MYVADQQTVGFPLARHRDVQRPLRPARHRRHRPRLRLHRRRGLRLPRRARRSGSSPPTTCCACCARSACWKGAGRRSRVATHGDADPGAERDPCRDRRAARRRRRGRHGRHALHAAPGRRQHVRRRSPAAPTASRAGWRPGRAREGRPRAVRARAQEGRPALRRPGLAAELVLPPRAAGLPRRRPTAADGVITTPAWTGARTG